MSGDHGNLPPELRELIDDARLPERSTRLLERIAHEGVRQPGVARELLEELVDHLHTGLERGLDEETILARFGEVPGMTDALARAVWARSTRRPGRAAERRPGRAAERQPPRPALLRRVFAGTGNDLRAGLRSLAHAPWFTVGNVVVLGLGLGAAVALYAVLRAVLLEPLPYEQADELYYLRERAEDGRRLYPSYPNFADWRRQEDLFGGVLSVTWESTVTVLGGERPVRARSLGVSRDFFEILGVPPVRGRTFRRDENRPDGPPLVMVSEGFWRRELGGRDDLDSTTLQIGAERFRVIGVVPGDFRLFDRADLYLPHEIYPGTIRSAHAYQVVARLADGVTPEQARERLDAVAAALAQEYPDDNEAVATDWMPLQERIVGTFGGVVWALFAASLLVMVVACSDVAAALLARGRRRAGEVALRRSLGASRWRVTRQLLTEALLLSGPALLLGLLLASAAIGMVRRLGADHVPRIDELAIDPWAAAVALLLTLVATALFSVLPVRQWLRTSPARALRSGVAGPRRHRVAAGTLIAGQVAIAFVLLAASGLLLRSLDRVLRADLGFDVAGVAAAHVDLPSSRYPDPEAKLRFAERLRAELAALPGVERTAEANLLPFDWGSWGAPVVAREDPENWIAFTGWRLVSSEYFDVLEIPLLEGSLLPDDGLVDGTTAVVVNESLAHKLAPDSSAVGRRIRSNFDPRQEWLTVVGVVEEARHWQAAEGAQPEIYVHVRARPESVNARVLLLETAWSSQSLFEAVEGRIRELDPDVPVRLEALTETLKRTLDRERLATAVLSVFAGIVLLLTLVGIVGVVVGAVAERRREVGIRLALGATPGQLVRLLQSEMLIPVLVGAVAGGALALVGTRALRGLLYEVSPADPSTYLGVAVLLGSAAFLGSLVPARQVLSDDPARTMRSD